MLSFEDARAMAAERIADDPLDLVLHPEPEEHEFGWIFSYTTRRFAETGDISQALAGNAPMLVDKHTGKLWVFGTAYPRAHYIQNYIEFGDPHKTASTKVELVAPDRQGHNVEAIVSVRSYSELGLAEAKKAIETVLAGQPTTIVCPTVENAFALVRTLSDLGYTVRHIGE